MHKPKGKNEEIFDKIYRQKIKYMYVVIDLQMIKEQRKGQGKEKIMRNEGRKKWRGKEKKIEVREREQSSKRGEIQRVCVWGGCLNTPQKPVLYFPNFFQQQPTLIKNWKMKFLQRRIQQPLQL